MLPTDHSIPLLYHFCRLRLPSIPLPQEAFARHLSRGFDLSKAKHEREGKPIAWATFLDNLYTLDCFLAWSCLEGQPKAWEALFAARASRTDSLLVDALRIRAVRLFPRDSERQDEAVAEFWGFLLAGERDGSLPILARYDGQRPLIPWLIRIFQNKHLSELRHVRTQTLPDDDLDGSEIAFPSHADSRWHEEFRSAAHDWLSDLSENEILILGLRLRYRLSQREVATLLGIHEGNISRQTNKLRDRCLTHIGDQLVSQGWTGEDLTEYVLKEMDSLLLDEPRLAADRLAGLFARRGKTLPT